jgi:hypothetical protein
MKALLAIGVLGLCAGCARSDGPFVQGTIRIVPPVALEDLASFHDGGTRWIKITDAEGKKLDVYIDHRLHSPTPGAVYLFALPGESNSVRVAHQREFQRKIGKLE